MDRLCLELQPLKTSQSIRLALLGAKRNDLSLAQRNHDGSLLSLLGFLLLVLLIAGSLHVLECLELLNKESLHNSLLDLGRGENTTVRSGDSSLSGSELSELSGLSNLNTLHSSSTGVLLEQVHDKLATGSLNWFEVVTFGAVSSSPSVCDSPFKHL